MGIALPDTLSIPSLGASVPVKITAERRRSVRASVGKSSLLLRIPSSLNANQWEDAWKWFSRWALQIIEKKPTILNHLIPRTYTHGEFIQVQGVIYKLLISKSTTKTSKAALRANQTIELLISESAIPEQNKKIVSELLHRLLSKIHLSAIEKRVHELNQIHFKAKIKDVKISHTRSRWGSCSKSGSIRISSRLLLAPPEVLDYVVIHELAHLREFNHSQHFWKLVSAAMPDYAEKEKWLKVNHYTCNF